MSRGFVKEDDQEETPIIPPRASLPEGVINYVTENGLEELKTEKQELEKSIANLEEKDERERRRALAVLNGKLNLLNERILSSRLLNDIENTDEVRFGAQVSYTLNNQSKVYIITIVGVDEANVKQNKIAFIAPIAKALMGKRAGENAELKLSSSDIRKIQIKEINYF